MFIVCLFIAVIMAKHALREFTRGSSYRAQ